MEGWLKGRTHHELLSPKKKAKFELWTLKMVKPKKWFHQFPDAKKCPSLNAPYMVSLNAVGQLSTWKWTIWILDLWNYFWAKREISEVSGEACERSIDIDRVATPPDTLPTSHMTPSPPHQQACHFLAIHRDLAKSFWQFNALQWREKVVSAFMGRDLCHYVSMSHTTWFHSEWRHIFPFETWDA